jgi:hypothetical protein
MQMFCDNNKQGTYSYEWVYIVLIFYVPYIW